MRKKSTKKIILYLLHGTGFLLLYFVIKDMDFNTFLELLGMVPLWKVFIGFVFLLIVYLLKSLRWMLLNRTFNIHISYSQTLVIYLVTGFLSTITPGRLGEFAKIIFLKKNHNTDYTKATSSVILDRVWDILVISLMAGLSAPFFFGIEKFPLISILFLALFFIASLILILYPDIFFKPLIFLFKQRPKINDRLILLSNIWNEKKSGMLILSFLLSLISFLILASIPMIFSAELNAPIPPVAGIGAVSISSILSYIPVTVAGFGTRELVFTNIWAILSYSKELALSISTFQFIFTYLGSMLMGGFLYLIKFRSLVKVSELRRIENPD